MGAENSIVVESESSQYQAVRFPDGEVTSKLHDDEIDLFELLLVVWRGRFKVSLVVALCIALGLAYILNATQWYETSFRISTAKYGTLFELNNSELIELTPGEALQRIRRKLLSPENFNAFYKEGPIAQELLPLPDGGVIDQYSYAIFKNQIGDVAVKVKKGEENNLNSAFGVMFSYPEMVRGSELLTAYLVWTDQVIKSELSASFEGVRENELLNNRREMQKALNEYNKDTEIAEALSLEGFKFKRLVLHDQLTALKDQLIKKNQQRITVLSENISIARSLGFKRPTTPEDAKELKGGAVTNAAGLEIINTDGSDLGNLPVYYRGYESLEAERKELHNRTRDDYPSGALTDIEYKLALLQSDRELERLKSRQQPQAFIGRYVALEKRNAHLNTLIIDTSKLTLYELDAKPIASYTPVKPKKLLIMMLAVFIGLVFGVLLVLVLAACEKRETSF